MNEKWLRMDAGMARWRFAVLLGVLSSGGCDRADDNSARASECERFCAALEKCDDATDLLDCREHCEADDVRSDRYFRARADCGEELSCSRWVQEVNGMGEDVCTGDCKLLDCIDDTLADVKLSASEENVCTALGTKLNACNEALDLRQVSSACEEVTPVLSEAYLDASARCGEQLCAEIDACFDRLSDRHKTDLRLFSGTVR